MQPINEIEQKEKFLQQKKEPTFIYRKPEYDTKNLRKKLKEIKVPEGIMQPYYKKYLEILELYDQMVIARGTKKFMELSLKAEKKPTTSLVIKAEEMLRSKKVKESEKIIPAHIIKEKFEEYFKQKNIKWKVKYHSKYGMFLDRSERIVYLNKDRSFGENEAERLLVHEVEVHIFRGLNGANQPWKLFAKGFPDYIATEEGLATYCEERTKNSNPEVVQSYAGRVIAVDSVLNNLSFKEAFERFKSFCLSDDKSWDLTLRAYRGGGYTKDYVYLDGYFKVKEFLDKGGDIEILYVGKIGLQHLDLVKKLLKEEILQQPRYLPGFITLTN